MLISRRQDEVYYSSHGRRIYTKTVSSELNYKKGVVKVNHDCAFIEPLISKVESLLAPAADNPDQSVSDRKQALRHRQRGLLCPSARIRGLAEQGLGTQLLELWRLLLKLLLLGKFATIFDEMARLLTIPASNLLHCLENCCLMDHLKWLWICANL